MDTCSVDGCEKPIRVKKHQLCKTHYSRWHQHGDPLAWKRPPKSACSVDGCTGKVVGNGLCDMHYRRVRRYGTTDAPERPTVCLVLDCGRTIQAHGRCDRHYRRERVGREDYRPCRFCGQLIDPNISSRRVFCSDDCKEKWSYLDRRENHRRRWLKKYGLTVETYDAMLAEQGGGCALCGTLTPPKRGGTWHVDHDHATGKVRGILCDFCNIGLGNFKDDPALLRAAADYLERSLTT